MLNKVENTVAKGEIAHHEQFHLWPQCFQKSSAAIASKYERERVTGNHLSDNYLFNLLQHTTNL